MTEVPVSKYEQRIPRPVGASPAGPAPWSHLAPGERLVTLDAIRERLAGRPPDTSVERRSDGRVSAVLVPVFEHEGRAHLVFTRRTEHLNSHQGQVSFPGGRLDPGETAVEAALREAHEEIGLAPDVVEIVGELDHLVTFSVGSFVTPVVGVLKEVPVFRPNAFEVARVFTVSTDELLSDAVFSQEDWGDGRPFTVPFFELEHETIWGATGRMLVNLFRVVLAV